MVTLTLTLTLAKAVLLAGEISAARARALRVRQQKADALMLIEEAKESLSSNDADILERKLQRFARAMGDESKQGAADGEQPPDELRREVDALRHELALLRRTVVSGFSELKEAVAQQRA